MTSEPIVPAPRPGDRPAGGAAAPGPKRRRRWIWRGLVAIVVLFCATEVGLSVRRVMAARAQHALLDSWTVSRRQRFRLHCLDEASRPLPPGLSSAPDAAGDYCTCVTEGLAAAFPSYANGMRAVSPKADAGDARRATEVFDRCAAAAR